jgi:AcrR family transcriptional regulator
MSYPAKPRKKPVQLRGEVRVEALIAAARALAIEMSPEEITTNRIAQRAGVNIGSLYHFFSNKYEIFVAVIGANYAGFEEFLRDALRERPANARDWARVLGEAHVRYFLANTEGMRLWRRYRFRPELSTIDEEYFSRVGGILRHGLAHYFPRISQERHRTIATVLAFALGELIDEVAQLPDRDEAAAWIPEIQAIACGYMDELERAQT